MKAVVDESDYGDKEMPACLTPVPVRLSLLESQQWRRGNMIGSIVRVALQKARRGSGDAKPE